MKTELESKKADILTEIVQKQKQTNPSCWKAILVMS